MRLERILFFLMIISCFRHISVHSPEVVSETIYQYMSDGCIPLLPHADIIIELYEEGYDEEEIASKLDRGYYKDPVIIELYEEGYDEEEIASELDTGHYKYPACAICEAKKKEEKDSEELDYIEYRHP